jgi:hypothetical protein
VSESHPSGQTTAGSIAAALTDPTPSWITLPRLVEEVPDSLLRAIAAFDAGDRPAGRAAAEWLRTKSVATHAISRTRLLIVDHRVGGFYSLASAQVALRSQHRREIGVTQHVVSLPAALVTWIAKDVRSHVDGVDLLRHAAATARKAALHQATALLVVDPFDEETDVLWRTRFGFRPSSEAGPLKRLWLPITRLS